MKIIKHRHCTQPWPLRIIVIVWLCIGAAASVMGEETHIMIWQKTGGTVSYALSAKPKIIYQGDTLLLQTENITIAYPVTNLDRITFDHTANGIAAAHQNNLPHGTITATPDGISIQGFEPSTPIYAYSLDGKIVATHRTDNNGSLCFRFPSSQRLFIVKAGLSTIKLVRP